MKSDVSPARAIPSVAAEIETASTEGVLGTADSLVCFCQLRWRFVFQRPQHLMTRFAGHLPVHFVEEPVDDAGGAAYLETVEVSPGIKAIVPHVPEGTDLAAGFAITRDLLRPHWAGERVWRPLAWVYTPLALPLAEDLAPVRLVYDCMDELSAFKDAPPLLVESETALLRRADVVFTGGRSLWRAKRQHHDRTFCFPSSIDRAHFAKARDARPEPDDQADIPHPRLGHYAVLDERLDRDLIAELADLRPDWHIVLVGPVVKIDPASLPRRPNVHYLGAKPYEALPDYLAGWDVAIMPFAMGPATRFISPTKTPEYLAAGRPVVSTPVPDVVEDYGDLVAIADDARGFADAVAAALDPAFGRAEWLAAVDSLLSGMSWDMTWSRMLETLND